MATNRFGGTRCIGFGFSPIVNDYKIVVIYNDRGRDKVWGVYQVRVYSLWAKSWKEIEFGNLEGLYIDSYHHSVSANGDVFWFGFKSADDDYCSVVSFDMANEIFTVIPLPASGYDCFVKSLTVYENNLALLCTGWIAQNEHCVKLWVMEKGSRTSGERWIWTHKYTSNICSGLAMLFPITIWGNEIMCEPEFESDPESESESESEGEEDDDPITPLYMFNIASNEFRIFSIPDCGKGSSLIIENYVESLVSISNILVENP
ncbi:uncharacterized protein LOC114714249 [Neltuma alba]|uniref:uncharacterized protein LOC114714249 n=1 Tax=Neltuma alba TaxID=207710 RepID=UPI0010A3B1A2|nr:uncharacterized protein LOC114714249 [Prosopis alba]